MAEVNAAQPIVLMPVLNGERHLPAQLASLAAQTRHPALLIVSDDGSADRSRTIVRSFAQKAPFPVMIVTGPGAGYARNVAQLLRLAPPGPVAFCDQDDVWLPDRIARAMTCIGGLDIPALHVAARVVTGPDLRPKRVLPHPSRIDFAAALLRNAAPANATILNASAARLAQQWLPRDSDLPQFPDWWIMALVSGVGGTVLCDPQPGVLYRQHDGNLFGARHGPGLLRRARMLLDGSYRAWVRVLITVLPADPLLPVNAALIRQARDINRAGTLHLVGARFGLTRVPGAKVANRRHPGEQVMRS